MPDKISKKKGVKNHEETLKNDRLIIKNRQKNYVIHTAIKNLLWVKRKK
jgi:hypothetical protein